MNTKLNSILFFLIAGVTASQADLQVFAAASATDAMKELAAVFNENGGESIHFNFASSATLARQIHAGAPADIFLSANAKWMDWLADRSLIHNSSRFNLAANRLVLIAPAGSPLKFNGIVNGRIAVGDIKSVPAGMYAKEALESLGWLKAWRPKMVMSSNVRTALLYVGRGEVEAGIVYATDAKASGMVSVIGIFPPDTHDPIVYPIAACSTKKGNGTFLQFLKSNEAKQILTRNGFK